MARDYEVAVIGGGIVGMATAARLQAHGLSTVVFEAQGLVGGCVGFIRRNGFAFNVGATTLVDFDPGGVGGEVMDAIGMPPSSRRESRGVPGVAIRSHGDVASRWRSLEPGTPSNPGKTYVNGR
jgi:phytoene dehydrogenase-like protein